MILPRVEAVTCAGTKSILYTCTPCSVGRAFDGLVHPFYLVDVLLGLGVLLTIKDSLWNDSHSTFLLSLCIIGHVTLLDFQCLRANEPRSLPQLHIIFKLFFVLILKRLTIICASEAPKNVLHSSLVHVLFQVVECMLGDVR